MRALIVSPGKLPETKDIENSLEEYQKIVGGYIEAVYPFADDDVCILCNEEGKLNGLPPNRPLRDSNGYIYDIICGTFIVIGTGEEDFIELTPEQVVRYMEKFREPVYVS